MGSINYRPEIDGLRAVAVIPVVLYHMGAGWIQGGYIGVDVFFVISGYLITTIILNDYNRGVFRFTRFWLRRIRRILPVLIVMVIVTSIAGNFLLYWPDINNLGKQGTAALLSVANITLWLLSGSYWGPQAENSLFLHTWSLSVEEQFYLFFPFLLVILLKFNKKHLFSSVLILSVISALLFLYGSQNHPSATFYLLPPRAWELGSGSLLAILTFNNVEKFKNNTFLSSIGLLAIILSYFFITGEDGVSVYLVIPVIGSIFVIAFSKSKENMINTILSTRPVVSIGKISYSLYIWHWPVLVLSKSIFLNKNIPLLPIYLMIFILTISIASYHLIEKTTRQNPKVTPYIFLILASAVGYSLYLSVADFSDSEDISIYSKTTWNGLLYNVVPDPNIGQSGIKGMDGITVPFQKPAIYDAYATGGIIKIYGQETPQIVVIGDSHALMWSDVLDEVAKELGISISFYAANATPGFFSIPVEKKKRTTKFSAEEKYAFDRSRLSYLKEWKPEVVVISVRWSGIKSIQVTQDLIEYIEGIGSKILLIEQPPELFSGNKNTPNYIAYMGLLPSSNVKQYISYFNSDKYHEGRNLIRNISEKYANCEFIQVADVFMNDNKVWVLDGTDVLYIDDDHLSHNGSLKLKSKLSKRIKNYFSQENIQ